MASSDGIWQHGTGSTSAQVTACCLRLQAITWTNIDFSLVRFSLVRFCGTESNFTASAKATILYNEFENNTFKITTPSHSLGQYRASWSHSEGILVMYVRSTQTEHKIISPSDRHLICKTFRYKHCIDKWSGYRRKTYLLEMGPHDCTTS